MRGVVIFIVLFAFADIASLDLYAAQKGSLFVKRCSSVSTAERASASTNSSVSISEGLPQNQHLPKDTTPCQEHCLGCCAHVLPCTKFSSIHNLELKTVLISTISVDHSWPLLGSPFRPPRLV